MSVVQSSAVSCRPLISPAPPFIFFICRYPHHTTALLRNHRTRVGICSHSPAGINFHKEQNLHFASSEMEVFAPDADLLVQNQRRSAVPFTAFTTLQPCSLAALLAAERPGQETAYPCKLAGYFNHHFLAGGNTRGIYKLRTVLIRSGSPSR